MTTLDAIHQEALTFMQDNYAPEEIIDGNELKFRRGGKTILTVYTHEDHITFLVIFGKKEREIFEQQRDSFSSYILDYYENSKTYHDGKWMYLDVTALPQLEEIKQLVLIKRTPIRK